MNQSQRFQIEAMRGADSYRRTDIVTKPLWGATPASGLSGGFRVLMGAAFILVVGLGLAIQIGKYR